VKFTSRHLSFLGHLVSPAGVTVDPARTLAIRNFPARKDAKGVARFIGMVNFFHKFIPDLAHRAAPLNDFRKKGVKFKWGQEQQAAFSDFKMFVMNPVLAMADFSQRFVLQTDASSSALGAVLLQEVQGQRRPIAFTSRTLSIQENKYSTYEIECLAVLFGVEKFRMYLEHAEFDLALSWFLAHPCQTGRIALWVVRLSAFKFVPHHIKGTLNVMADTLSRMFETAEPQNNLPSVVALLLYDMPWAFTDLKSHKTQDPESLGIIQRLEAGESITPYWVALLYRQI
jgi:hypothetical protein